MEPNKDHIKDIFSSKLSDFKPEVPSAIWGNIDKHLDQAIPNLSKRRTSPQKIILTIGSWIAGSAAIVLFLLYLYPNFTNDKLNKLAHANEFLADKIQLKELKSSTKVSLSNTNTNKQQAVASYIQTKKLFDSKTIANDSEESTQNSSSKYLFSQIESINTALLDNVYTSDKDLTRIIDNKKESASQTQTKKTLPQIFETEKDYLDYLLADNSDFEKKISKSGDNMQLGLIGGSGFFKSDNSRNELKTVYPGGNPDMAITRESKLKMKHNQPITVGLTISKKFNEKLSVESGVVYIYLSSKFKTEDIANIRQNDMQYIHYLGIPVTLNYNFAEWKKFKFYSSMGGLIQKDFYGRKSSNMYIDGVLQSDFYTKEKISQRHPQFSIHGGLGASYPLYDKLRVYTNFGGAYYFDAKNEHETIYSDKKWLFNINVGLRFEF